MLLATKARLDEIIVEHLSQRPLQSVRQLARQIAKTHRPYSVPALYQELRKLREQAVVAKIGNNYSLRLGWVMSIMRLADEMHDSYIAASQLREILPAQGAQQTWRFSDLSSLGRFATQILLVLIHDSEEKEFFEWVPQAWFPLTHVEEEFQFLRTIRAANVKHYMIIGDDNPLNRRYMQQVEQEGVVTSLSHSPFHGEDALYYAVAGDFFSTMKLSSEIAEAIAKLFSETSSQRLDDMVNAVSILKRKSKLSITIEHRPQKSLRFAKIFKEYFGIYHA